MAYLEFTIEVQMSQKLHLLAQRMRQAVADALMDELTLLLEVVKERTPIDTGRLRKSEHVEGPFFEGPDIRGSIVAGGAEAPYAVFVHEILSAHHDVGEAKFIERPMREVAPFLCERIARRLDLAKLV